MNLPLETAVCKGSNMVSHKGGRSGRNWNSNTKDCDQDGVYKWCTKVAGMPLLKDKGLETSFLLTSLDAETELVIG